MQTSDTLRFVGGGALSDARGYNGQDIETVENTKDTGSMGALLVAVGSGVIGEFDHIEQTGPCKGQVRAGS
ncbi:MAG: hypothetical protein V8R14_06155 [Clostridia bacterium]